MTEPAQADVSDHERLTRDRLALTRHIEALVELESQRQRVKIALMLAHPEQGCLPLPNLSIPRSMEGLYRYATQIENNLLQNASTWTVPWTQTLTNCNHGLDPHEIVAIVDLLLAWRALVNKAADHAYAREPHDQYTLGQRSILLTQAYRTVLALTEQRIVHTECPDTGGHVDHDVVGFVRTGFGDNHGLRARSLNFDIPIPNRATFEAALIDGIGSYNRMSGKVVARRLGALWDDLSYTYLGRETDPYLRLWLPHTHQQRNGGDNHTSIATTAEERADLIGRIRKAGKACAATVMVRSTSGTANWSTDTPTAPSEVLLTWQ